MAPLLDATLKLSHSQNMRQAASLRVGAAAMLLLHAGVHEMQRSPIHLMPSFPLQALPFVHWALLYILGITFVLTLVLLEPGGRYDVSQALTAQSACHRSMRPCQLIHSSCIYKAQSVQNGLAVACAAASAQRAGSSCSRCSAL